MAKKLCYLCEKEYAVGKVLEYPVCRKCKKEVEEYSKKAVRLHPYTIEQKFEKGNKKFNSKKDFLLGMLFIILCIIVFTFAACLRYGGF